MRNEIYLLPSNNRDNVGTMVHPSPTPSTATHVSKSHIGLKLDKQFIVMVIVNGNGFSETSNESRSLITHERDGISFGVAS